MRGYIFTFQSAPDGPAQYDPDGKIDPPVQDVAAHNTAIVEAELAHWRMRPDRMLAYYKFPFQGTGSRHYRPAFAPPLQGASVSTWTGEKLGVIVSASVYRGNFGGRMVALKVRGSNGAMYHGRASWDNGDCVWLRRCK